MAMNIVQINAADVNKLADLMQQKEILAAETRNTVKRLNEEKGSVLVIEVTRKNMSSALRQNDRMRAAIDSQSEWIIDRIYDTAIQTIEKEIALLAEKIMKNLIASHKPY